MTTCETDSEWEAAASHSELRPLLCDDLEGWDRWEVGGRFKKEGIYVCLWLPHADVWQKPTQQCKAIIFHLKMNLYIHTHFELISPASRLQYFLYVKSSTLWCAVLGC